LAGKKSAIKKDSSFRTCKQDNDNALASWFSEFYGNVQISYDA